MERTITIKVSWNGNKHFDPVQAISNEMRRINRSDQHEDITFADIAVLEKDGEKLS